MLRQAERAAARRVGSVCSGAPLLASAGLLDGRPATTQWDSVDGLRLRRVGDCIALDI